MRLLTILFLFNAAFQCFATDYSLFEENGKVGLKDNAGTVVLPASFDALGWSDGNFSLIGQITGYRQQNRWGLLNLKKEFITKAVYESITSSGGDRVVVSKLIKPFTVKFGCLDLQGKEMIPFLYDDIRLHELRAIVMIKNGPRFTYGLTDLNGAVIVPVQYQKLEPLGSLRFVVQDFNGKNALCTESGKWVTGFFIDDISSFQFDLAIIRQEWKCGIINRAGEIKVEPSFREIEITGPSTIKARNADSWRVINARQESITTLEADDVLFGDNGWNRIKMRDRWGLLDNDLKVRWPVMYDEISQAANGQALVKRNGKYGLLRHDGSEVLPIRFDSVCAQGNFVRVLQREIEKSSWSLYDTFGIQKTEARYEAMGNFNGKFFPVKNRGFWGGVDRYGKETIACVYDSLLEVNDFLVAVRFKGQYGIINLRDEWQVTPQTAKIKLLAADHFLEQHDSLVFLKDFQGHLLYFTDNPIEIFEDHLAERLPDGTRKEINFQGQIVSRTKPVASPEEQRQFHESEGLTGIYRDGKFGFVDARGRLRIANRYDSIAEFHEGLAAIKLLGRWGFINPSDQIVIQPAYQRVGNFNQGVTLARKDGKSGLIARDGSIALELRYDAIEKTQDEFLHLRQNGLHGLADAQGHLLIEPRFESLEILPTRQVIVKQNNRYGLITIDGMSLFPIQYSQLVYWKEKNQFFIHEKPEWKEIDLSR